MQGIEELLRTYGLIALFIGAVVEGDVVMLLAGMLVHFGVWEPVPAILTGAAGGLTGDLIYFYLGHGAARKWMNGRRGQKLLRRVRRFADRLGIWCIFLTRYVYGVRSAVCLFFGMRHYPYWKFTLFDGLNSIVWASLFCGLGFLFSEGLYQLMGDFKEVQRYVLLAVVALGAATTIYYFSERFEKRVEQAE